MPGILIVKGKAHAVPSPRPQLFRGGRGPIPLQAAPPSSTSQIASSTLRHSIFVIASPEPDTVALSLSRSRLRFFRIAIESVIAIGHTNHTKNGSSFFEQSRRISA